MKAGTEKPTCFGPECEKPARSRGLCNSHYEQQRKGKPLTVLGSTSSGGKNRLSIAEAVARAYRYAPNFVPNVDYPGANEPWAGMCLVCGQPIKPRLSDLKKQGACGYCIEGRGRKSLDMAIVIGTLRRAGAEPLVPFPGARKPWRSQCLSPDCRRILETPTYNNFKTPGTLACQTCAKRKSNDWTEPEGPSLGPKRTRRSVRSRVTEMFLELGHTNIRFEMRSAGRKSNPTARKSWVLAECVEHGEFEQPTSNVLNQSTSCPQCGERKRGATKSFSARKKWEEVCIKEAITVRGWELREKSNGENQSWLIATCQKGHDFEMSLGNFASGKRCNDCADWGYSQNAPSAFYVVGNETWLKCGKANISNLTYRLKQHQNQGLRELCKPRYFDTGKEATDVEDDWKSFIATLPEEERCLKLYVDDGFTEAIRNRYLYLRHALILASANDVDLQNAPALTDA